MDWLILEYLCIYSHQVHKYIFNKNHKNPFIGLEALPEPFVPSVLFLSLRKDWLRRTCFLKSIPYHSSHPLSWFQSLESKNTGSSNLKNSISSLSWWNGKKMVNVIVEYNFFRFPSNIVEQEKMFFSEARFLPTRMLNTLKEDKV